jgi:hypothetical protein
MPSDKIVNGIFRETGHAVSRPDVTLEVTPGKAMPSSRARGTVTVQVRVHVGPQLGVRFR